MTYPAEPLTADGPEPIESIGPMTDDRAIDVAEQALQDMSEIIRIVVDWGGLDDRGLRYRRVLAIAAMARLRQIRHRLKEMPAP